MTVTGSDKNSIINIIGPGLLLAGSAVGVSHLVQSTRAGAMYGSALVIFIFVAMLAKYPSFLFPPRYAAATRKSVLSSYYKQGMFAMVFYGLSTVVNMFIGAAANVLVTAGLLTVVFSLDMHFLSVSALLYAAGMALLIIGHYHWLDLIIKALMVFLTIATIVATIMALPMIDWSVSGQLLPAEFDLATVLFIAALVGWMPTPSDVSVWQSQWVVAKIRDTGYSPTSKEADLDFNIGYLAILILALCFVILGTAVMHGSGIGFKDNPAQFAGQVIGLYEEALGKWSSSIVGIAAVAVMFSTLLTILDGFPRGLANFMLLLKGREEIVDADDDLERLRHRFYWSLMLTMVVGAMIILGFFYGQLTKFIDISATIAFLSAPIFALLNHRAIMGNEVPQEARPGYGLYLWSVGGIVALSGFALLYIYLAFFN